MLVGRIGQAVAHRKRGSVVAVAASFNEGNNALEAHVRKWNAAVPVCGQPATRRQCRQRLHVVAHGGRVGQVAGPAGTRVAQARKGSVAIVGMKGAALAPSEPSATRCAARFSVAVLTAHNAARRL
jgi:hypothetical protein